MFNRISLAIATVGLGLTLMGGAWAETPAKKPAGDKAASHVTMGDKSWVAKMNKGGAMEVALSQLASTKGASAKVKEFAKHMVTDHSKANAELKTLADKKGIKVDKIDTKADSDYKKLSALAAGDFDKQYIEMMVKGHEDTVKAFESEAAKGGDPNLKAWASKTLPTLRSHLKMVKEIQASLGKK